MIQLRTLLLITCLPFLLQAQDVFFSQFYAAPHALNPAMGGFYNGDMRVAVNYRDNSNGLVSATTTAASFDLKMATQSLKPNVLAIGAYMISDREGATGINNSSTTLNSAFHYAIDAAQKHYVSAGLQMGLFIRSVSPGNYRFGNQWSNSSGFNPNANSGETIGEAESKTMFDLNLGTMWYSKLAERSSFYAGFSFYHITQPTESFYGLEEQLPMRYSLHTGFRYPLSQSLSMMPNLLYTAQNKASLITVGSSFEYQIAETSSAIKVGGWYRTSDKAVIFSTGFQVREVTVGLSSDFTSAVQNDARTNSPFELSVIYAPYFNRTARLKADPTKRF